ncbi:MAG: GNAT family N-acetyltransferase [Lachnospiraceae bacterium]|nr:GNAT family N-acetyltransferase [Lachnospiraceae bacterium]
MKLRKLEPKDAEFMLEWMHDSMVVKDLRTNFSDKTIEDCEKFIKNSCDEDNVNLAIVDAKDDYLGTVSLKHISKESAEFAITIRKEAMGKGYSKWAMEEILKLGFEKYDLEEIYWCVSPKNLRAVRFYDKNRYQRCGSKSIGHVPGYNDKQIAGYIWYRVKQ